MADGNGVAVMEVYDFPSQVATPPPLWDPLLTLSYELPGCSQLMSERGWGTRAR